MGSCPMIHRPQGHPFTALGMNSPFIIIYPEDRRIHMFEPVAVTKSGGLLVATRFALLSSDIRTCHRKCLLPAVRTTRRTLLSCTRWSRRLSRARCPPRRWPRAVPGDPRASSNSTDGVWSNMAPSFEVLTRRYGHRSLKKYI